MQIHEILEGTTVNGPGFRLCVWVQGCERMCDGCFNKETWSLNGGKKVPVNEIIKLFDKQHYDGITISGGEPFLQDAELSLLLEAAKKAGLSTFVFSGFRYEELKALKKEALKFCDYLVDGAYKKDIPSLCKYTGSGNQRYLQLDDGEIKDDLTEKTEATSDIEVHIAESGELTITGFGTI